MTKQKETKRKAAPKTVEPEEDGGNDMGLSSAEMQEWLEVQEQLIDKGYGPEDVQRELLKKNPKAEAKAGSGLMASARTTLAKPVTWKHVVYMAVGIIGFIGLLKLVGMAFDVNIPMLHTASGRDVDMDI